MTRTFRIVLPLEVYGEFEDEVCDDLDWIKEELGQHLDQLLMSTDYLGDYWKAAQVEEV